MSHAQPIRVLLVDDHVMYSGVLADVLSFQQDIELVGVMNDGEGTLDLCAQLQPDVVLMDIMMRKVSGIEATRQIHHHFPKIKVIILSGFQETERIEEAMQAGALVYLTKGFSLKEIADTIRGVML
jgi:two-component system, NarL family, response regulator LiaR